MDDLWPICWVIVVGFFVAFTGHAIDHKAKQSVRLVLAFRVQVKEYRAVSIKYRLKPNSLPVIVLVLFILVCGSESECANTPTDSLFKCVVVCFVGNRVLLVCPIETITSVSECITSTLFGNIINCNPIVSVFVDNADDRQHDLVDLEPRLVLILIVEWTFPLCSTNRIETSIL